MSDKNLSMIPEVAKEYRSFPDKITQTLGLPRDILATDAEIERAMCALPDFLQDIQPAGINEDIAKLCVAVSAGLFDSAINYIWNTTIVALRARVESFGVGAVSSVLGKGFERKDLESLTDASLIQLCLQLNLISDDAYFFLDQCRDVRNNFSAAHPFLGRIDNYELTSFISRCVKYALSSTDTIQGVDVKKFIDALEGGRFAEEQKNEWVQRLSKTNETQRVLLFGMLHGRYCDSSQEESVRLNALDICMDSKDEFGSEVRSNLINRHSEYVAKGNRERQKASNRFFEKLGLLSLLTDSERHSIVSSAIQRLWEVHLGMNNFYNEPPFAERLYEIAKQGDIPETAKEAFVQVVIFCYIGNRWGFSWDAEKYYERMIEGFTSKEIAIMLTRYNDKSAGGLGDTISKSSNLKERFVKAVGLIDPKSVPEVVQAEYAGLVPD